MDIYTPMLDSMHISMPLIKDLRIFFLVQPLVTAMLMSFQVAQPHCKESWTPRQRLDWRIGSNLVYFRLLHIILLAILKYRAAHTRKVLRWREFDTGSRVWMYLREIFHHEAKMAFLVDPFFSDIWDSLCNILVAILFPRPIAFAYLLSFLGFMSIYLIQVGYNLSYGNDPKNVVYNGRRYRCERYEVYYYRVKDENQNFWHYPALDFNGLLPIVDEQVACFPRD
jgi:hypothetical protein